MDANPLTGIEAAGRTRRGSSFGPNTSRPNRAAVVVAAFVLSGSLPFHAAVALQSSERQDAVIERMAVRGMTRMYLEDYDGAERIFEDALRIRPDDPALLASMSQTKMGQGDFTSADFFLRRALAVDSTNASLWRLASEIYAEAAQSEPLLEAHRRIARLDREDPGAHLALVDVLLRLNRFGEALVRIDDAAAVLGDDVRLLERRADVYERLGRATDYDATLERLVELDLENTAYRMRLGASLIRQDRLSDAETVLADLLLKDPDLPEAIDALAHVYEQTGRDALAASLRADRARSGAETSMEGGGEAASMAELRTWVEEHPDDTGALIRLAERLEGENGSGEAAALYRRVVSVNPRSLEAWAAGIEAFLSAGLPEDALRMADDGLLLFPGYVPLRVLRARSLVGARRIEEAVALISVLRENDLSASEADALDALMERIETM